MKIKFVSTAYQDFITPSRDNNAGHAHKIALNASTITVVSPVPEDFILITLIAHLVLQGVNCAKLKPIVFLALMVSGWIKFQVPVKHVKLSSVSLVKVT